MAKVSSAVIKLVLRLDKVLSDGSNPIMLRCQFNGRKQVSTGCSCTVRYWDAKNQMVKKGYPNAPIINAMINKMKKEAIDRRDEFELNGIPYTPEMVLKKKQVLTVDSKNRVSILIDRYTSSLSPTTCKVWKSFWNSFKDYVGNDNITINEIDLELIKGYARHLEKRELKSGTILMMVSKLNAICKFAIEDGIISSNPFNRWNFCKKYKADANMLYVDISSMEVLKEMLLERLIIRNGETYSYIDGGLKDFVDRRSDLFVLAFYLFGYTAFGLAPIDLAKLKVKDMSIETVNGVNYYCWNTKRQKTGVGVKVMVSQNKFFDNVLFKTMLMFHSGEYLLPVLDGVENDHMKIYKKVSNWLSNHSDVLKEWFKKANERIIRMNVENSSNIPLIPTDCTFYSYRSSFAMALMQNGGNLLQLCTMLGRGINASLKSYVRALKQNQDIADSISLLGE